MFIHHTGEYTCVFFLIFNSYFFSPGEWQYVALVVNNGDASLGYIQKATPPTPNKHEQTRCE